MTETETEAKIRMIQASMRCFMFGLLGLLPLIGIPFAVLALLTSGSVRARQKTFWNPAQSYWIFGVICAVLGVLFWGYVLAVFSWNQVKAAPDY